jgi:antagonist of SinR
VRIERLIEEMDLEWMVLILEAKKLGISKETVRDFLDQNGVENCLIEKS